MSQEDSFWEDIEYPKEGEFIVRIKAAAMIPSGQGYPRMRFPTVGHHAPSKILGEIDVTNAEGNGDLRVSRTNGDFHCLDTTRSFRVSQLPSPM